MPTEDHIGDVIAKECFHQDIAQEAAAKAAGLSLDELDAFQKFGESRKPVNYDALGELLGMDAAKLRGIANKWEPTPPDLLRWPGLRQVVSEEGFAVNAYLVWDTQTKEAAIFDTGWSADGLFKIIEEEQLNPTHFFITHSHIDHIADMNRMRERFPNFVIRSDMKGAPDRARNKRDEVISVGSLRISNYQTTGHAADGVTYVVDGWPGGAPKVVIVGDAIFAGSMGKGKLSPEDAKRTARESILTLPDDTLICAGHGPFTTVGQEKQHNPFF
jgi:hydroxyacylglutathione hydrolase